MVLKHVWYITGLSLIISTLHKAIDRGTQNLCLLCTDVLWILIRNDNNNEGITIDGEEFKLSQYADAFLFIFVGSPDSYDGILRVLDYFDHISELKINFSMTHISKEIFHPSRWQFSWNNCIFDLLCIKFSVNLEEGEIENLNYLPKLLEIKKLTPEGRKAIIKTLIIPKLN